MRTGIALFVLCTCMSSPALADHEFTAVDWKQPPVGCIEDFAPQGVPCLDLTGVADPQRDLPSGLSGAEIAQWQVDWKFDLVSCRAKEVLRREKVKPGTYPFGTLYLSFMKASASDQIALKIRSIYEQTEIANMPPNILFGALSQESLLSDIGIEPDGENYSCGIAQLNVQEWCRSMNQLSAGEQAVLGWPASVSCDGTTLPTALIKPFYDIAVKTLGARQSFELVGADFQNIEKKDVVASFPAGSDSLQEKRFLAAKSFVMNCQNPALAIQAKARELKHLYDAYVPATLRARETYGAGETFARSCNGGKAYASTVYPLQTAWLLAVGMYNAGSRITKIITHYFGMTKKSVEDGTAWSTLTPPDLVEAFHWGGKYSAADEKIHFQDVYGKEETQAWFKSCVLQRHIARVAQFSTLSGQTSLLSLEKEPCKRGPVPAYRQQSSGKK